ncbi:MAG: high-potential iron-sulfur protein [Betaproteobacteria bacterium]
MNHTSRRIFIARSLAGGCAFAGLGVAAVAHAAAHVEETDDTAVALGYHHDTQATDAKKYPNHTAAQRCVDCSFWQGAPTDAWAGCAMFGRKQVAAGGWCSAFAKKPA